MNLSITHRRLTLPAMLVLLALVAAACGGSGDDAASGGAGSGETGKLRRASYRC